MEDRSILIQFPNFGVTSTYFADDGGRFSHWRSCLELWLLCGFLFVGCATTLTQVERDAMIKEYEAWQSRISFYAPIAQAAYRDSTVRDRKSTRLNSSHLVISYAVFCLKKKKKI